MHNPAQYHSYTVPEPRHVVLRAPIFHLCFHLAGSQRDSCIASIMMRVCLVGRAGHNSCQDFSPVANSGSSIGSGSGGSESGAARRRRRIQGRRLLLLAWRRQPGSRCRQPQPGGRPAVASDDVQAVRWESQQPSVGGAFGSGCFRRTNTVLAAR